MFAAGKKCYSWSLHVMCSVLKGLVHPDYRKHIFFLTFSAIWSYTFGFKRNIFCLQPNKIKVNVILFVVLTAFEKLGSSISFQVTQDLECTSPLITNLRTGWTSSCPILTIFYWVTVEHVLTQQRIVRTAETIIRISLHLHLGYVQRDMFPKRKLVLFSVLVELKSSFGSINLWRDFPYLPFWVIKLCNTLYTKLF